MIYELHKNYWKKASRFPFWSFCQGRGYKFHKTQAAAARAADEDARGIQRAAVGGQPEHRSGCVAELNGEIVAVGK